MMPSGRRDIDGLAAHVAVIIAFFQREPGLLANAVRSALAQSAGGIHVIVVDDGSPLRARDELAGLADMDRSRVTIIEQPNAGPGAARNRGIAAVAEACDYIAFLDSDDVWAPDHIARALTAFALGADLYFTDYVPLHRDCSTFAICGLSVVSPNGTPPHRPEGEDLFTYGGDLFDALLRRSPIGTSTVVYRRTTGAGVAFPADFSYCEDIYFWMLLARSARKVMFSTCPGAIYGPGVNIGAGSTWGTPASLNRLYGDYRFHWMVERTFPLTPAQRRWNRDWMRESSRTFIMTLLHLIRHRKPVAWAVVARFVAMNPALLASLVQRRVFHEGAGAAAKLEIPR